MEELSRSEKAATKICPICGERFVRGRYGNRYGSGERIEEQRYCGKPACRQRAYRGRRDIKNNIPARKRRGVGKIRLHPRDNSRSVTQGFGGPKSPRCTPGKGSVTQAKFHQQIQRPVPPQKTKSPPAIRDTRIVGPADVIAAECFGRHSWQTSISSDGVKVEVARLRHPSTISGKR